MNDISYRHKKRIRKLSEKNKLLALEYIRNGGNAYQAAITIGMTEYAAKSSAHRILKVPYVKDYIEKQMKQIEDNLGITFEWKLRKLKTVVEQAIPNEEVPVDKDLGKLAVTCITEMNKMQGDYAATKVINTHTVDESDLRILKETVIEHMKEY